MKKAKFLSVIALLSSIVLVGCANRDTPTPTPNTSNTDNKPAEPSVVNVESIAVSSKEMTLKVGEGQSISVSFTPSNATNQDLNYSSSNDNIAMVSSQGNVKAIAEGEAIITVTSKANSNAKATVTVHVEKRDEENPFVEVTEINVSPLSVSLDIGATKQLIATLLPENATNKLVSYTSSNDEIAMVSSTGLVRAISDGDAKITIKSESNTFITKIVNVHVNKQTITITKVELKNKSVLNSIYDVRQSIDFSKVTLLVTYSDGSNETLTESECDIEKNNAKASTEFILKTETLASQTTLIAKGEKYKISAQIIKDPTNTIYPLTEIQVVENISLVYNLTQFQTPDSIVSYNNKKASASENSEGSYKVGLGNYTIGDDNEFIYNPNVTLITKAVPPRPVSDVKVELKVEVFEINSSVETKVEPADNTYQFNPTTSGIKFASAQVGKTFKLKYLPKDFETIQGESITPLELVVDVKDGYNGYSSKDLGRINLISDANIKTAFDYNHAPTNRVYDNYKWTYDGCEKLDYFYDPNTVDHRDRNVTTYSLWKDYLVEKGEQNLNEIKGIYLHNDISVGLDDLPDGFAISEQEAWARANSDYAANTLRDRSYLYTHFMIDNDFEMNGNGFKVDFSSLPFCKSNSDDTYPNFVYSPSDDIKSESHSSAFNFVNHFDGLGQYSASVKNVNLIGNLGNVLSEDPSTAGHSRRLSEAAGCLIGIESFYGKTNIDNVISTNFLEAVNANGPYSNETVQLSNSRIYDCYDCGIYAFGSQNTIINTEMKRFGGPALFAMSLERDNTGPNSDRKYIGVSKFSADSDCVFESMVTGNDAWFIMHQASDYATMIKGIIEPFLNDRSSSILQSTTMNLTFLGLDTAGIGSGTTKERTSFKYGNYAEFNTYDDATGFDGVIKAPLTKSEFRNFDGVPTQISSACPIINIAHTSPSQDQFGYMVPANAMGNNTPSMFIKKKNPDTGSFDMSQQYTTPVDGDYLQFFYPSKELAMVLKLYPIVNQ